MRERYLEQLVRAEAETSKAFCCSGTIEIDGVNTTVADFWIPKSVILEDSHDDIDEAVRGEFITIYVAKWWLANNL